ncbi:hypothetical protein ALC56_01782 [Trachymyrmex septentrionalis]|uniref:Uncharacterized protein n=1 Tax=Trachymyrmex septentrionalis TaxID=34720 RepID=A0A195FSV1_9HYME|nr:hypothetical protein ALC56_01782 [Trachymyrmex septentrionalis]
MIVSINAIVKFCKQQTGVIMISPRLTKLSENSKMPLNPRFCVFAVRLNVENNTNKLFSEEYNTKFRCWPQETRLRGGIGPQNRPPNGVSINLVVFSDRISEDSLEMRTKTHSGGFPRRPNDVKITIKEKVIEKNTRRQDILSILAVVNPPGGGGSNGK